MEQFRDKELEAMDALKGQFQGIQATLGRLHGQFKTVQIEVRSMKGELNVLDSRLKEMYKAKEDVDVDVGDAKARVSRYRDREAEYMSEYNQKMEHIEEIKLELRTQIAKCETFCARVKVTKPTDEIEKDIRRLKALLKEQERLYIILLTKEADLVIKFSKSYPLNETC
jgi:chromosome segregation ATPase